MTKADIKRKLRALKSEEIRIRGSIESINLIFNGYFDIKGSGKGDFSIDSLQRMNHEERKITFETFILHVYMTYFRENHISLDALYNPEILKRLGLPIHATEEDVKVKFREMAKKYHPDKGGSKEKFVEIMALFDSLK